MLALPGIGVASANTGQIRTGALGAPQERAVINKLARNGVVAIPLGFRPERADLLGMAHMAAFADVDVPAFQFER